MLAPVRERLLAKRLQDDLHLLLEELAVGLGVQHRVAERLDLAGVVAASDAEDDPALGQDVRDRVVLGEAERMPGGHDVEGAADLHALGAVGEVHRQHRDARDALVPLVLEVMLGQPQRLVPERVGRLGQRRRGVERLGEALVGIAPVVGGHAREPAGLQLDVADVEGREARDHGRDHATQRRAAGQAPLVSWGRERPDDARHELRHPRRARSAHARRAHPVRQEQRPASRRVPAALPRAAPRARGRRAGCAASTSRFPRWRRRSRCSGAGPGGSGASSTG